MNQDRTLGPMYEWLIVLLVFAVSFLPRGLGFVGSTTIWQTRAEVFMQALANRDWRATLQAPHPGVTTMWLAGLARSVGLLFDPQFDRLPLAQRSAIELLPIALSISLAIAWAYHLLARLFGRRAALLSALLLALDPYHISLSKAIHVDALVSVFAMLSALHLWALIRDRTWHNAVCAGAFAALAMLTKTPALFMLPYFGLCMLAWAIDRRSTARQEERSWPRVRRDIARAALLWTLAYGITYVALWPSMWSQPLTTLRVTLGGSRYYQETPHENPIYFLGQATTEDPGPLFYPVTMAIKTTAVSLLGFVLGLTASFDRKLSRHQRLALWLGAAFVVCFAFQMTLAEKKFARYALPALQFVALVAGVGWTWILGRTTRRRPYLAFLGALCLIALQFAVSIPRHPYYGTHYNYMLGGPKFVLEHGIVDGQEKGEGLEIAAAYLNDLPLSKLLVVGAQSFGGFYFYFDGKAVPLTDDHVDYLLFARSQVLRQVYAEEWWSTWEAYRQRAPKLVVAFDGVPYVWVYKTGPIIDEAYIGHPTEARIGPAFRLLGYDFEPDQARPGETTHLSLYWECAQQQPGDYTVFVHLIDVNGEMRGQQDNPPQHGMYPTYLWDTSERIEDRYALVVEPTTSPGQAQFAVGMYSLATMERLPITNAAGEALADRQILLEGPSIRP